MLEERHQGGVKFGIEGGGFGNYFIGELPQRKQATF
jgi:hypothetical protein